MQFELFKTHTRHHWRVIGGYSGLGKGWALQDISSVSAKTQLGVKWSMQRTQLSKIFRHHSILLVISI